MNIINGRRASSDDEPSPEVLDAAAKLLGRPVDYVDFEGYECELLGAAIRETGEIAYVESRSKDIGPNKYGANQRHIDITIKVHLVGPSGQHESADIESYNPFFGCNVYLFEWIGPAVLLIYSEKHWTFACRYGDVWPPKFVKIDYRWIIDGSVLAHMGYKADVVRCISVPDLEERAPMTLANAESAGLLPSSPLGDRM